MDRLPSETESVFDVWKQACNHVVHYSVWLICCFLGLGLLFLVHENLTTFIFLRVNPWSLRAYDKWGIYLLGMIWIVGMFLVEGYLRGSHRRGRLLTATLTVLSAQLLLIAVSAASLYFRDVRDLRDIREFIQFF